MQMGGVSGIIKKFILPKAKMRCVSAELYTMDYGNFVLKLRLISD